MQFEDHGIRITDVSFYQDDDITPQKIDFVKMKSEGIEGVICRAGQHTWQDEDFADYWRAAKSAMLPRGSYWLFDSRSTPESQAMRWKNAIGNDLPELGLWVDLEEYYHGPYEGEANWKRFINAVISLFPGVKIGIYTSYGYWDNWQINDPGFFAPFPLWLAWYVSSPGSVIVPRPWVRCVMWQYTSHGDGTRYGVESFNIDLSLWNGTRESFRNFFNLSGDPVPPPGGTMDKYMKVTDIVTGSLNVRYSGENLGSQNDLGSFNLLRGDIIHVVEGNTNYYLRFDALYRNGVAVDLPESPTNQYWALEKAGSDVYLAETEFTPPQQPSHVVEVYIDGVLDYRRELM